MITTALNVGSDGAINLGAGPTFGILLAILFTHGIVCSAATGVLVLTVAAELAAERPEVRGPGTFLPVLLDELSRLTPEILASRAKAKVLS